MKTTNTKTLNSRRSSTRLFAISAIFTLMAVMAQAQISYTPVFSNVWVVAGGTYADLPANAANNVRGAAINPVTTNVLYASNIGGTNNGAVHVSTVSFASGSNFLAGLNSSGIASGTLVIDQVRVADDGTVYACNLSGGLGSSFKIYKWPSDTDVTTAPTTVVNVTGPTFTWRIGDYMDLRGSGINTEIVAVGNGSGAAITTNFVVFRPTDASCTMFTNFSITVPGSTAAINLCGGGVTFEGTNNAIWIRRSGSAETRRVAYDPAAMTATVTRTNAVDQTVCQGLKYFSSTNGVEMLATVQGSITAGSAQIARVFRIPTGLTGAFVSVLTSNFPTPYTGSQNGNPLGNVDAKNGYVIFGAPGYGLTFFKLDFTTNEPPAVSTTSSATTIIQGYGWTNTASASGSVPLSYQWYFTNGPATNLISGAITNIYSIASLQTSNAGGYFVIVTNLDGRATSGVVNLTVLPNGSSSLMTNLWSLAPGSRTYLTTTDTQRGLAYDPILNRLVLVSRASTNGIHLLDAATGADAGEMDISALLAITPPGTLSIDMCGVADDGIVYVGNLITSGASDNFAIYSWGSADPAATITQAYAANPGIGRIGDTMAVRGAGLNTEILCAFRTGTNVALFNTTDGVNFNFNLIAITNLPAGAQANGFAGLGLAFGPGNTFWAKSSGFDLRQVTYDAVNGVGGVINDYSAFPITETAIGVDNANGFIAAIGVLEFPQSLPIYDLNAIGGPSLNSLVDREFFPTSNANGNGTGAVAVDVAGGRMFALDSNNGIIALSYAGKVSIAQAGGSQIVTWPTAASVLQSSTNVAGPYLNVPGATSPYTNNTDTVKFFRLKH